MNQTKLQLAFLPLTTAAQLQFDDEGFDDDYQMHAAASASGAAAGGAGRPAASAAPPDHACAYCGVCDPSCLVKCMSTGKWFCNGRANRSGSCAVLHLVKGRYREVQLHKDSPLGEGRRRCKETGHALSTCAPLPRLGEGVVVTGVLSYCTAACVPVSRRRPVCDAGAVQQLFCCFRRA